MPYQSRICRLTRCEICHPIRWQTDHLTRCHTRVIISSWMRRRTRCLIRNFILLTRVCLFIYSLPSGQHTRSRRRVPSDQHTLYHSVQQHIPFHSTHNLVTPDTVWQWFQATNRFNIARTSQQRLCPVNLAQQLQLTVTGKVLAGHTRQRLLLSNTSQAEPSFSQWRLASPISSPVCRDLSYHPRQCRNDLFRHIKESQTSKTWHNNCHLRGSKRKRKTPFQDQNGNTRTIS